MGRAEAALYEILGLLVARHWRWGWVLGAIVLLLVVVWLALAISGARPDVSGTPQEIADRWNEASRGIPPTAQARSVRAAFVNHLRALGAALAQGDDDAADGARDRIAEDFGALRTLRVRHGLAK